MASSEVITNNAARTQMIQDFDFIPAGSPMNICIVLNHDTGFPSSQLLRRGKKNVRRNPLPYSVVQQKNLVERPSTVHQWPAFSTKPSCHSVEVKA
jgi:hypothetical protein